MNDEIYQSFLNWFHGWQNKTPTSHTFQEHMLVAFDAGYSAQAAEIERLREENKALVAALEPFGRPENAWLTDLPDSTPVVVNDSGIIFLSLALRDLRKAREVLSKVRHGL